MNINYENVKKILGKGISLLKSKNLTTKEILDDLQKNHNHSWFQEIYERNKNSLDDIALIYRANKITYRDMFKSMRQYAKSLGAMGIKKGDEIPICVSNTPELVYILGALSMLGCKANIVSEHVDEEYLLHLIDDCNSDVAFVEDSKYDSIQNALKKSHIKRIIMPSIASSLKNGNPYKNIDARFGGLDNTVVDKMAIDDRIIDLDTFLCKGNDYKGVIDNPVSLDDEFTITYSSGTTCKRPKPIVHTVRSFITIGRCHDPEIQKTASMKKMTIGAIIPPYSNTDIICSISDALMQGSKLALEPKYDKEQFIYSLLINKPNYIVATRSFWINMMKKVKCDHKFRNVKMPFLLIPFAVGEPLDIGEEKFLNKGLRKLNAGKDVLHLPISPVTMCVAGGDCEHGGIFWLIFRALQSKKPGYLFKDEPVGMKTFPMVEIAVLDENGNHLPIGTYGRLVANSPCNMKCYKNMPEKTKEFFIKDKAGKVWGDCDVYAKIDENGHVTMKGRIPKGDEFVPSFVVADAIVKDTKNILSCEVVEAENGILVAHVEFQPERRMSKKRILISANERCRKLLGDQIADNLVFRVHGFESSFELNGSGKRDLSVLRLEGISKAIKVVKTDDRYSFVNASDYFYRESNEKKM